MITISITKEQAESLLSDLALAGAGHTIGGCLSEADGQPSLTGQVFQLIQSELEKEEKRGNVN